MLKIAVELLVKNPNKLETAQQVDVEQALAEDVSAKVKEMVDAAGFVYVGGAFHVTWATKQDALLYTPRKKHLRDKDTNLQVCDVPWVSKKNLVDDPAEVTCKRCLDEMKLQKGELPKKKPPKDLSKTRDKVSVYDLGLTSKGTRILVSALNIGLAWELEYLPEVVLRRMKGCGVKTVTDIRRCAQDAGFTLGGKVHAGMNPSDWGSNLISEYKRRGIEKETPQ